MSNICKKCGNEIPEGNKFCPECGKKVKNSNSNTSNKKIIPFVIGGGIVVAILILVIVLVVIFGGNNLESDTGENSSKRNTNADSSESVKNENDSENDSELTSPKSIISEFFDAYSKGDITNVKKMILPEYYNSLDTEEKEDIERGSKEYEEMSNNDVTFTLEYGNQEKIIGDELDELKEELSKYGADISEAYEIAVKIIAKKGTQSATDSGTVIVVKSSSKYYIYEF